MAQLVARNLSMSPSEFSVVEVSGSNPDGSIFYGFQAKLRAKEFSHWRIRHHYYVDLIMSWFIKVPTGLLQHTRWSLIAWGWRTSRGDWQACLGHEDLA